MSQYYAIVFQRAFAPGQHWHDHLPAPPTGERHQHGIHRAPDDDVDRRQHWGVGDLYSTGTVVDHDTLPAHLVAIPCDPPRAGQVWDTDLLRFVGDPQDTQ